MCDGEIKDSGRRWIAEIVFSLIKRVLGNAVDGTEMKWNANLSQDKELGELVKHRHTMIHVRRHGKAGSKLINYDIEAIE